MQGVGAGVQTAEINDQVAANDGESEGDGGREVQE